LPFVHDASGFRLRRLLLDISWAPA
jgi:hypothetical protein